MRTLWILSLVVILSSGPSTAQEDARKPEKAFVRMINASTVTLKEPWKSGVDLVFKGQKLAEDIRAGEAARYRQISFTGKDTVEARATGQAGRVGSVPATFEKGAFYSIYLTGMVNDDGFHVTPLVVRDFPVPEGRARKGFARLGVFNAISTFPIKLRIDGKSPKVVPPGEFTEVFLPAGTHPYRVIFPYRDSERDTQGFFVVTADSEFNAIISTSSEKPDRPTLRFLDNSAARSDALEAARNAGEERKKDAAGGSGADL